MKILNLGCGNKKIRNAVNVDVDKKFNPDIVFDLNKRWTFAKANEFDIVIANHIIEHLDDIYFIMSEIHRVEKNGGIVKIKVPHYSGKGAYYHFQHKHYCSSESFNDFSNNGFIIKKRELHKCLNPNSKWKLIGNVIDFFANLSIWFCESFWVYSVGGFGEICIELEVIK